MLFNFSKSEYNSDISIAFKRTNINSFKKIFKLHIFVYSKIFLLKEFGIYIWNIQSRLLLTTRVIELCN